MACGERMSSRNGPFDFSEFAVAPSNSTERRPAAADHKAYWRANLRLIAVLLAIWAVVSFGFGILLVERLNTLSIGRVPLGFWFAQQGSIYVFVILIFVYAWRMDRLDKKFKVDE